MYIPMMDNFTLSEVHTGAADATAYRGIGLFRVEHAVMMAKQGAASRLDLVDHVRTVS